jgi:hypothetical protein
MNKDLYKVHEYLDKHEWVQYDDSFYKCLDEIDKWFVKHCKSYSLAIVICKHCYVVRGSQINRSK